MKIPPRNDPSDFQIESFEDYYARWPNELAHVPESVVRMWMWEHNDQVIEFFDQCYDIDRWSFRLEKLDNKKILEVRHFADELEKLDDIGDRLIKGLLVGYNTAEYMLENGTFPCPIIVVENGGQYEHHRSHPGEKMLEPYHLIEGNRRLAFVRALNRHNHPNLQDEHDVWVVTIEEQSITNA